MRKKVKATPNERNNDDAAVEPNYIRINVTYFLRS